MAGLGPLIAALLGVIALATYRRSGPRAFLPLAVLIAGTALEALLKTVLDHPGPPHALSRTLPLPPWLDLLAPRFGNAFPSGHAFRATFLLGLAIGGRRAIAIGAAIFAVAMWVTRLYAAEHWPSDVAGGIALGVVAAALVAGRVPRHGD